MILLRLKSFTGPVYKTVLLTKDTPICRNCSRNESNKSFWCCTFYDSFSDSFESYWKSGRFFSEMASRLKTGRPWFVCTNPSNFIQRPQRRQKNALNRKVLEYNKNTRYGGERGGGGGEKNCDWKIFLSAPTTVCHMPRVVDQNPPLAPAMLLNQVRLFDAAKALASLGPKPRRQRSIRGYVTGASIDSPLC